MLADDKAIDLEAWLDSRTFLLGCPKRLVDIAYKRYSRKPLTKTEARYLERHRDLSKVDHPFQPTSIDKINPCTRADRGIWFTSMSL